MRPVILRRTVKCFFTRHIKAFKNSILPSPLPLPPDRDQVVSIVGNKGTKEIGKKETQKLCLIGRNVMTLPSFRTPKQLNLGFKKPQDMDFRFNPKRLHALVELLTKVNADSLIKMAESVIKAREKKLGKNRTRVGLSCKGSAKKRKSRSWYAEQMAIAKKMGKGSIIKNIV